NKSINQQSINHQIHSSSRLREIASRSCGWFRASDGAPEDLVEFVVVDAILLEKVHASGGGGSGGGGGVPLFEAHAGLFGDIRPRIRARGEGVAHGGGRGVELRHGTQAQDHLDGAKDGGGGVVRAIDEATLGPGAQHEGGATVGIDVVGAILRVVFEHKDRDAAPYRAAADGFDDAAERVIIIGY